MARRSVQVGLVEAGPALPRCLVVVPAIWWRMSARSRLGSLLIHHLRRMAILSLRAVRMLLVDVIWTDHRLFLTLSW